MFACEKFGIVQEKSTAERTISTELEEDLPEIETLGIPEETDLVEAASREAAQKGSEQGGRVGGSAGDADVMLIVSLEKVGYNGHQEKT